MTYFYEEAFKRNHKFIGFLPRLIPQNLPNMKMLGILQLIALAIVIRIVIRLVELVSAGQQKLSTRMDIILEHIVQLDPILQKKATAITSNLTCTIVAFLRRQQTSQKHHQELKMLVAALRMKSFFLSASILMCLEQHPSVWTTDAR